MKCTLHLINTAVYLHSRPRGLQLHWDQGGPAMLPTAVLSNLKMLQDLLTFKPHSKGTFTKGTSLWVPRPFFPIKFEVFLIPSNHCWKEYDSRCVLLMQVFEYKDNVTFSVDLNISSQIQSYMGCPGTGVHTKLKAPIKTSTEHLRGCLEYGMKRKKAALMVEKGRKEIKEKYQYMKDRCLSGFSFSVA